MAILDLGDDKQYLKVAKLIQLGDIKILPICMGCDCEIAGGQEYYSNSSGALTSHKNKKCVELAKEKQMNYWVDID